MKKFIQSKNYLENSKVHLTVFLFFLALLSFNTVVNAQCALHVDNHIHIILSDDNCDATLTAATFLSDDGAACAVADHYEFEVRTADGTTVLIGMQTAPVVDETFIGGPYKVIIEAHDGAHNVLNTAMSTFDVADKKPPTITCPTASIEVACWQDDATLLDAIDNCSKPTLTWTDEVIVQNDCSVGVDGLNWPFNRFKQIKRTYVAVDASGNTSLPCTVTLNVNAFDYWNGVAPFPILHASIWGVPNFQQSVGTAIACQDADSYKDADGNFDPNKTGWPDLIYWDENPTAAELLALDQFDTVAIDNNCTFNCNLAATYIDVKVNTCPNCIEKVLRMWTVVETNCDPNNFSHIVHIDAQHIEVYDNVDPIVVVPDNQTITTNTSGNFGLTSAGALDCGSMFTFPVPQMSDNCHSHLTWTISVKNDIGVPIMFADTNATKSPVTKALPHGLNTVTYIVYDNCGNSTTVSYTVNVVDNTPPVPVCQVATTVSLTYDGEAELFAPSLNSGSYDDCAIDPDRFEIKRMGDPDSYYAPYITFTCADNTFETALKQVILRVWDKAGNSNECMVFVGVQDKLPPSITCPGKVVKECDYAYDQNDLTKYFGWPTYHDNCGLNITTDSITTEYACFASTVKQIDRTFTATDAGGRSVSCTQHIYFNKTKYFGYKGVVTTDDAYGAITWPADETYTSCMSPNTANDPNSDLHPNQTGRPTMVEFSCEEVGASYVDQVIVDNDNDLDNNVACFKIIRTWTVLDDCHKVAGKFAKWEHDQVIFVTNSVDPTISTIEDETICTFDSTCTDGHIDLEYTSSDDCTQDEDMRWQYYLDYDNDNALNVWDYTSPIFVGNNLNASNDYPIGTHKILWKVWDQCGNSAIKEQLITIMNCKKPSPISLKLEVDLTMMGGTPTAMVAAEMLNHGSKHSCGYRLVYSFSADTTNKIMTFGCNDEGLQTVQMWVTAVLPDGTVTQDYTETTIDVQDNFNLCPDPIVFASVSGTFKTGNDKPVEDLKVLLLGSEQGEKVSNTNGEFIFEGVEKGRKYSIRTNSPEDYINGVSTLDIVHIQKHLLSIKRIQTPYEMIASDVNNDKRITASDILILRKLILGVKNDFGDNQSWRYLPKNQEFDNVKKPLSTKIDFDYEISNLNKDMVVDFIAIKIGDINGDAKVNGSDDIEDRSSERVAFEINNSEFISGDLIEIPVYANDFENIQGLQTTFSFDEQSLEFVELVPVKMNLNSQNYATNRLENGYLPMSWTNDNSIEYKNNDVLFVLKFKALKTNDIKNTLSINSDITRTEAYNSSLEKMNIELNYRNEENDFALYQNKPNPFSNTTLINFISPDADSYSLKVFNLNGQLVYKKTGTATKGLNSIKIEKSSLNVSGVLYYTLNTGENTATKKMVVLK